jgi:hypothetical protein
VIVRSAGLLLAADATVARASSDDMAADSGQGVSLDLFFWDSRRACWTRIRLAASASEYPFALIAAGMESLVTGFGSQVRKKKAPFLAWASTLYSFLFADIAQIERELGPTDAEAPEKRETIMLKHHYRPRIIRL